jgi:hypothetical protein
MNDPSAEKFLEQAAATAGVEARDLIIQMGRNGRIVYGETSRGFREELTSDRVAFLQQATRSHVDQDLDPINFDGKRPAIEIKTRQDESVFRQEQDGSVSINYLPREDAVKNIRLECIPTEQVSPRIARIVEIAEQIGLGEEGAKTQGRYTITRDRGNLTVSESDRGEIVSLREGFVTADLDLRDISRFAAMQQTLEQQGITFSHPNTSIAGVEMTPIDPEAISLIPIKDWLSAYETFENWQEARSQSSTTLSDTEESPQEFLSGKSLEQFTESARQLVDPLGIKNDGEPVEIHDYVIELTRNHLTVSKWSGDEVLPILINASDDPSQRINKVTSEDLRAFQSYIQPEASQEQSVQAIAEAEGALQIANLEISQLEAESPGVAWVKQLTQDVAERANQVLGIVRDGLTSDRAVAISDALEKAVGQGTEAVKTAWQSEAAQTSREQVSSAVKAGIQQGWQWLKSRPEAIRDQRVAQAAFQAFEQGSNRTQETQYDLGDGYNVKMHGLKNFVLTQGDRELMQFAYDKPAIPGLPPALKIQNIDEGMTRADYKKMEQVRQSGFESKGTPEREAVYLDKVKAVESIALDFLQEMGDTQCETPNYQISLVDDGVQIEARDGRGLLYESGNLSASSLQLAPKDFQKFQQLAQIMQQDATRQADNQKMELDR